MGNLSMPDKGSAIVELFGHRTRPKFVKSHTSVSPNWNIWDIIRLPDSVYYALCYVYIRDVTHKPSAGLEIV